MKTITIINYKGGVAKTTSAFNIAGYLACKLKKKVLCIDLDSQANLTVSFGVDGIKDRVIGSCMIGTYDFDHVAINTNTCGITLAPASLVHDNNLRYLGSMTANDLALKRVLQDQVADLGFDFCIIDCAPSLNLFTINALAASDYFLVPVEPEFYATVGLTDLLAKIKETKKLLHPNLEALGAFITKNNRGERRKIIKEIKETLNNQPIIKILDANIRVDVKLVESPKVYQTIFEYAPDSRGAEDYAALVEEILTIISTK